MCYTHVHRRTPPEFQGLEYVESCGSGDENMLILGDNLRVMERLLSSFRGRVTCMYADPPYNEKSSRCMGTEEYTDMMEPRLRLMRELLTDDGSVFLQIGARMQPYMRVLMDRIFGERNLVAQIVWQRVPEGRIVLGQGSTPIPSTVEYILYYARDRRRVKYRRLDRAADATEKVVKQYSQILEHSREMVPVAEVHTGSGEARIYAFRWYRLEPLRGRVKTAVEKHSKLVQSVSIHRENSAQQRILAAIKDPEQLHMVEYRPTRGRHRGRLMRIYYLKGRRLLPAREYTELVGGRIVRKLPVTDLWLNSDIQVTGLHGEGGVGARRRKKPEALLHRIIQISTDPGDTVFDPFCGSGTAAAVAHKCGRRWICAEIDEDRFQLTMERMRRVVDGERTGISDDVGWRGGGGFSVWRMPSV